MAGKLISYKTLLRAYPKTYRNKYAGEMTQTLQDMLADQPSRAARAGIWLHTLANLPLSVTYQQLLALGNNLTHETPSTVKKAGVLSGVLLLPFFGALIANEVSQTFFGHALYQSWLWRTPVLTAWVLILPAAAFAVTGVVYAAFVLRGHGRPLLAHALDIKRLWPVMIALFCGLSILLMLGLHDSVHCITGNPIRELHNPHDTLQCVNDGFLGGKVDH
jgi:hypothetical protein